VLTDCRLTVFSVALADWVVFGLSPSIATYVGGALIIVAFGLLTKETLGDKKK
jgi:drug/metabolite transporter (DMT)-like permease